MKKYLFITLGILIFTSCTTSKSASNTISDSKIKEEKPISKSDTIRIANDSLEYEVTIIDAGFNLYLNSRAKPRKFYGLSYMETRNVFFVSEWNRRVLNPFRYDPNLYELRIDYDPRIHYGYEVNYLIYNYFLYFQEKYKQKL